MDLKNYFAWLQSTISSPARCKHWDLFFHYDEPRETQSYFHVNSDTTGKRRCRGNKTTCHNAGRGGARGQIRLNLRPFQRWLIGRCLSAKTQNTLVKITYAAWQSGQREDFYIKFSTKGRTGRFSTLLRSSASRRTIRNQRFMILPGLSKLQS